MTEAVLLDPPGVYTETRTQLDITQFIKGPAGVDWGDAAIQSYLADQVVGSVVVDRRLPNRQIKIPLVIKAPTSTLFGTIRNNIQQKVGIFQRWGGLLARVINGVYYYVDVEDATLHLGGSTYQADPNSPVDVDGVLTLDTLPDWFGAESTCTLASASFGCLTGKLQQSSADAIIAGNLPGRVRIQVSDTSGSDQKSLLWGFRCKNFDSAATAALMIEPEIMSPINGAASGIPAFSPSSVYAVYHSTLPPNIWVPILMTSLNGSGVWQQYPGTGANNAGIGTQVFTNPNNVANGLGEATLTIALSTVSEYLLTSAHNFNLPPCTVNGIQVTVGHRSTNGRISDSTIHLAKAGVVNTSVNRSGGAVWPASLNETQVSYGGPADLWGTTWTQADINNSGFGAAISATCSGAGADVGYIGNVYITVYFTPTAPVAPLTHQGTYRVWARCFSSTSFQPLFRLQWGAGSLSAPITNDTVQIPSPASGYYLLDLGVISIDPSQIAPSQWFGVIQAQVPQQNALAAIEKIYFQPLDETAGKCIYLNSPPASSAQTVNTAPGVGADSASTGNLAWTNPTLITALDGNFATIALGPTGGGSNQSHYLEGTTYGFSIPTTATILGIQVQVSLNMPVNAGSVTTSNVIMIKGGVVTATTWHVTNLPVSGGANVVWTYGGPTDLANIAWAPSDINASNFGAAFWIAESALFSQTVNVDCIQITVWYTLTSGFTVAQDAVVFASKTAEIRTDGQVRAQGSGNVYGPIAQKIGDQPRIPVSGLENRPVELFAKPSRGDLASIPDVNMDAFNVQVVYRPTFLYVGS